MDWWTADDDPSMWMDGCGCGCEKDRRKDFNKDQRDVDGCSG